MNTRVTFAHVFITKYQYFFALRAKVVKIHKQVYFLNYFHAEYLIYYLHTYVHTFLTDISMHIHITYNNFQYIQLDIKSFFSTYESDPDK